jgi:two-component system, NarL family, response regulator DevR
MEAAVIHVFIVDDHEIVRRGIEALLRTAGDIVVSGQAGNAEDALARLPATGADVALLDLWMPGMNGIDLCREIRSRFPDVRCLMLSGDVDEQDVVDAVLAGASGYIVKQVRGGALIDSIRTVAAGQSVLDPLVTGAVLERLRHPQEEDHHEPAVPITEVEESILRLLGQGMTNREIAAELCLAEKTVRNYLSRLMGKLGAHGRTEAAVWAVRAQPGVDYVAAG